MGELAVVSLITLGTSVKELARVLTCNRGLRNMSKHLRHKLNAIKFPTLLVKDIVHVNAIISFAAVSLEIKFTKFLFLVWHNMLMLKLALVPLQEKKHKTVGCRQDSKGQCSQFFSIDLFTLKYYCSTLMHRPSRKYLQMYLPLCSTVCWFMNSLLIISLFFWKPEPFPSYNAKQKRESSGEWQLTPHLLTLN